MAYVHQMISFLGRLGESRLTFPGSPLVEHLQGSELPIGELAGLGRFVPDGADGRIRLRHPLFQSPEHHLEPRAPGEQVLLLRIGKSERQVHSYFLVEQDFELAGGGADITVSGEEIRSAPWRRPRPSST